MAGFGLGSGLYFCIWLPLDPQAYGGALTIKSYGGIRAVRAFVNSLPRRWHPVSLEDTYEYVFRHAVL